MGKHKATKVVRKKRCFPLILLFHCAATSVSPLFKCLELAFIGGGGGEREEGCILITDLPFLKTCWSVNEVLASTEERSVDISWYGYSHLRTFALIVSAHPYSVRNS